MAGGGRLQIEKGGGGSGESGTVGEGGRGEEDRLQIENGEAKQRGKSEMEVKGTEHRVNCLIPVILIFATVYPFFNNLKYCCDIQSKSTLQSMCGKKTFPV